jgi:hypothetical protein
MFNESNTVEAYVRDLLAGSIKATPANTVQESLTSVVLRSVWNLSGCWRE